MHPSVRDTLELTADKYPEKDALIYPRRNQRWTYAEFDAKANRLANALADLGVEKGDRVATLLHNGTEIVLTLFACAKLGAVFTPLNYRFPAERVEYVLDDAAPALLIFEEATREVVGAARSGLETIDAYLYIDEQPPAYATGFYERLTSANDRRPETVVEEDDIYALLYTAGTTGHPKGVVHEQRNAVEHTLMLIAEEGLDRTDVGLTAFPLYHAGELHGGFLPRVQLGATNVIHHEFDPVAVLRDIAEYEVSVFFAAPTGWAALLRAADDVDTELESLRLGSYGGAPISADVLDGCLDLFDAEYFQGYGMTEIAGVGTVLHPEEQIEKRGSAGIPALNRDLRIVEPDGDPDDELPRGDVGEIIIASPATMREYWNRPEQTTDALHEHDGREWYYTGDIGYVDANGYLYVVDRKDDMIISGGENIYPTEIEDVLLSHPDVTNVAVVGEPHEKWGEQVVAYVVGETTAADLDRYVRDSDAVADFTRPRKYYFVDGLPTNPVGKIEKFKLRDGTADVEPKIEEP